MKKLISLLLCTATLFALVACSNQTSESSQSSSGGGSSTQQQSSSGAEESEYAQYKIGMCTLNMSSPSQVLGYEGTLALADELGFELMSVDSEGSPEKQVTAIENFIQAGCDGIVISAVDGEALRYVIDTAREQGIKIYSRLNLAEDQYDLCTALDNYDLGWALGYNVGQYIVEKWGDEEIEVGILNYDKNVTMIDRREGIEDGLAETAPNCIVVDSQEGNETDTGLVSTESMLQAHPNIRVMLGVNDSGILGAYEAFIQSGRTDPDTYLVAGIDCVPAALNYIKQEDSIYQMTIYQDMYGYGYYGTYELLKLINGEDAKNVECTFEVVTHDNYESYVEVFEGLGYEFD